MPKIVIRMERNLGRDHGIGEPYCAVADPEERPRGPAPLIVRVNWGPKGQKNFFETPPPLISGSGWPPPSLSEGLDPPLWRRDPHKVVDLPLNTTTNFLERSFNFFFKSFPNFPSAAIGRSPVNFKLSTIVATENVKILSTPERQRRIRNWKIIF